MGKAIRFSDGYPGDAAFLGTRKGHEPGSEFYEERIGDGVVLTEQGSGVARINQLGFDRKVVTIYAAVSDAKRLVTALQTFIRDAK